MATVKQTIGRNTGAGSVATQYKKSAKTSASVFTAKKNQRTLGNMRRRRSNGGAGG